jgi:DNA-binding NarL/FixJ family response regulator
LAALLADQAGCSVVGQIAPGDDLPASLAVYQPEAILWDIGPAPSKLALEELAEISGGIPPAVVLLPDDTLASQALNAGGRGLLLRDSNPLQLVLALISVSEGLVVLDPRLAAAVAAAGEIPQSPLLEELTPRELQVLQLLAEGLSNKAIALRLSISEHTVKFHVNALMGKLGVESRTQAVVRATRLGLILL